MISEEIKQHLVTQQMNLEQCLNALQANLEANEKIAKRLSLLEERTTIIENEFQLLKGSAPNWQTLESDSNNLLRGYTEINTALNGLFSEFEKKTQSLGDTPQQLSETLAKCNAELMKLKR